jgi:hypothetical protein
LRVLNKPSDNGSLAILGPSASQGRPLGGSEDPWLCVTDFGQVCLYQRAIIPIQ